MATSKAPKKATPATAQSFDKCIPTNLSVCRSLNPGLFPMFAGTLDGSLPELPLLVQEHAGLGTTSQHMPDPRAALEASSGNPANPNPVRIERAFLPAYRDTLVVRGSIHVIPGAWKPESCTNAQYLKAQSAFVDKFEENGGFEQLAERYLMNVINGRWLARNRMAQVVLIEVKIGDLKETFDANNIQNGFSLKIADLPADKQVVAKALVKKWAQGLCAKTPLGTQFVEVVAKVQRGVNQEVFPSQPFKDKEETSSKKNRGPSRFLSYVLLENNTRQAVMHAEKVGNGLRTIDDWYAVGAEAIAVEPYGSVPRFQQALRLTSPDAKTFYELQNELEELTANMTEKWNDALYFGAMLVRGGMFGRSSGTKEKAEAKDE